MAAAAEPFADRDVDDVTMGEIARPAGVAEGTAYLYFESKAALVNAVIVAFYERLTETAAAGVRRIRDTRKRAEFLAEHHVGNVIKHSRILFAVPRKRLGDDAAEERQLNRTYVAVFDDVVREGIDRGEIRDDLPPWLLRDIFYESLEYAARTSMIHGRPRGAKLAVGGLLETLDAGVMTGSESPRARARALVAPPARESPGARRTGMTAFSLEKPASTRKRYRVTRAFRWSETPPAGALLQQLVSSSGLYPCVTVSKSREHATTGDVRECDDSGSRALPSDGQGSSVESGRLAGIPGALSAGLS